MALRIEDRNRYLTLVPAQTGTPSSAEIFNHPPVLQDRPYIRSDLQPLIEQSRNLRLSQPKLRSYLDVLTQRNNSASNDNDSHVTELEREAKEEPQRFATGVLVRKTWNTSIRSPHRGLTVDEKLRTGAEALDKALDTFKTVSDVDSITAFAHHINNALNHAWAQKRLAKAEQLLTANRPKTNDKVEAKPSPGELKKEPDRNDLEEIENEVSEALGDDPSGDTSPEGISAMSIYLKEITQHPLLTKKREIELAKQMETGKASQKRLENLNDNSPERAQLEAEAATGDRARQILIESNLRLVVNVARKYTGRGLSLLDLIQEGSIGLQRGVDKYDWKKGFRVSTYIYWWIKQAVTRAVATDGRTVRLPVHVGEQAGDINKAQEYLMGIDGKEPSIKEIADYMGRDEKTVAGVLRALRKPLSLEDPVGEDGDSKIADFISDDSYNQLQDTVSNSDRAEAIKKAFVIADLTSREIQVLASRFGLESKDDKTLAEVGAELGVTRERARQLEVSAMRRLKHSQEALDFLGPYLS